MSSLLMGGVSGEAACGFPRFGGVEVVVDCAYEPLVLVEVNVNCFVMRRGHACNLLPTFPAKLNMVGINIISITRRACCLNPYRKSKSKLVFGPFGTQDAK